MYGFSDDSLKWYNRVIEFILPSDGNVLRLDPALFLWHRENLLIRIIALHVDDFLWSGDDHFERTVINKLWHTFVIGKEEKRSFRYLGLNIQHKIDEIVFHQFGYIEALKPMIVNAERMKDQDQPSSEVEKEMLHWTTVVDQYSDMS